MLLGLMLVGCGETDGDPCYPQTFPKSGYVTSAACPDTTATLDGTDSPIAQVVWGEEGLDLIITGGSGYNFEFGIVQNDDGCEFVNEADDDDTVCWEGEACLANSTNSICHPAGSSGTQLSYTANGLSGEADINAGDNTAFPDDSYEFLVTYYLKETTENRCWVWGLETEYFTDQDFSCDEAN
jgi:hypothetical protein